jgi:2-keto-3-deoxy-L-rhamnonate aldolase RhmA
MKSNRVRQILDSGGVPVGLFLVLQEPYLVEMMGYIGFDYVMVDHEHTTSDEDVISRMALAANAAGLPLFIRIGEVNSSYMQRMVDAGVAGFLCAQVRNREDIQRAVEAIKYPPAGHRGVLPWSRASLFGLGQTLDEHIRTSNQETMLFAIIENQQAVENIEQIVSVDGLDGVMFGPCDMSLDMGIYDRWDSPEVIAAMGQAIEVTHRHGRHLIGLVLSGENLEQQIVTWREKGAGIILYAYDIYLIQQMFLADLAKIRRSLDKVP